MPDNQQLQAQLDKLQEVLGKAITLDPSKKPGVPTVESESSIHTNLSSSDWQGQYLTFDKSGQDAVPVRPAVLVAVDGPAGHAFDDSVLCIGDSLEADVAFCPFDRIEQYPEQFIGKQNRPLAQPFFDGIGERKTWRFFELYFPGDPQQSCLLVPTIQFVQFLEEINAHLGTRLCIPGGINEAYFSLTFGQGSTPRPHYIGPSAQERPRVLLDEHQAILDAEAAAYNAASEEDQQSWLACWRIAKAPFAYQRVDTDQRARLTAERAEKKKRDCKNMLGEVQARLGTLAGQQEQDQDQGGGDSACASQSKPFVFVSIDIEVLEEEPQTITEIGIAVLDTRNINDMDGGPGGILWWKHIKAHHLLVRQYASHVNHKYVQGCPGMFQFGQSTFPDEWELIDTLDSILGSYTRDPETDVLLVGHDIQSDVRFLAGAGYDVVQALGSVHVIDTQILHQAWNAGKQARKLQRVLSDLCIPYAYLHNAGNDAMYTLRAMITMGVEGPMPAGQTCRRSPLAGEHSRFDTENKKDSNDVEELW
ncbi:hypothetical protein E4U21_004862 [Claviceps maximensis]|nr:hypothetical protein E4U21_004862 [Claviceps maximensis]